jgi:hypothetical protein
METVNPDHIAQLCFDFYDKNLSKNGKPNNTEWTILSAIIIHFIKNHKFKIVSLATGSKCLPFKELPTDGNQIKKKTSKNIPRI